ncbi:N-acetylmuramoyl-L-alanine amidase [Paraclostridium bifermentans]|uniref:N-acetylmuramoyl-L-alanine amidase n=1 Tax=Paraclostridium bifermentans TaxID=1490 RepID=A0ABY8R482_PARBF|nr:N-acetylmuramoyl-L-alanine amidase [Paraclostridium bifermentans]
MSDDESVEEKDINLQITLKLRELLESSGCLVLLTREDDVSLYEESQIRQLDRNTMKT